MQSLERRVSALEAVTPTDPFEKALSKLPIETVRSMLAEMEQMQAIRTKPAGPFEKAIGTMTVEKAQAMIDEVEQRVIRTKALRVLAEEDGNHAKH